MSETAECIFCKIARGDLGTKFVAESEHAVAFRDLDPKAPTHVLVVPRHHFRSLDDLGSENAEIAADLLALSARVGRNEGITSSGYRVLTNSGPDAGQTVFHLHFHVLGGRRLTAGLG